MRHVLPALCLIAATCLPVAAADRCYSFATSDDWYLSMDANEIGQDETAILRSPSGETTTCTLDTTRQSLDVPMVQLIDCGIGWEAAVGSDDELYPSGWTFRGMTFEAACGE